MKVIGEIVISCLPLLLVGRFALARLLACVDWREKLADARAFAMARNFVCVCLCACVCVCVRIPLKRRESLLRLQFLHFAAFYPVKQAADSQTHDGGGNPFLQMATAEKMAHLFSMLSIHTKLTRPSI